MGCFGTLLGLAQQGATQSQFTSLQNSYGDQKMLQQQQSAMSGLFATSITSAAQSYTYTIAAPYFTDQAPERDTNEAWLDRRVNEMRVKL